MIRFPAERNGHDEFQYFYLVDHGCRAGRRGPDEAQADFLAFIASQPDAFHFSYEYLKVVAEERLAHGHAPLRVPSLIEFVELLEFRESELLRTKAATGEDLYWQWPSSWPAKPSWNSHVSHSVPDVEGALVDRTKLRDYMLATTRRGIELNKILAGHGTPVVVDYESSLQMSRLLGILVSRQDPVRTFPIQPQIWRSMDLPNWARSGATKEQHPRCWQIDGVLGDYKEHEIRIHERAITRCSVDTGIDRQSLFRVVLLHEFAHHFLRHAVGYHASAVLGDTLGEALAQLLVFLSLRDMATPNDTLEAFQGLLPYQPSEYQKHEDLLRVTNDSEVIVKLIHGLEDREDELPYDEFREMLQQAV
jgi:hypothetical protein